MISHILIISTKHGIIAVYAFLRPGLQLFILHSASRCGNRRAIKTGFFLDFWLVHMLSEFNFFNCINSISLLLSLYLTFWLTLISDQFSLFYAKKKLPTPCFLVWVFRGFPERGRIKACKLTKLLGYRRFHPITGKVKAKQNRCLKVNYGLEAYVIKRRESRVFQFEKDSLDLVYQIWEKVNLACQILGTIYKMCEYHKSVSYGQEKYFRIL